MAGEWRGDFPLVVWLVEMFVDKTVVKATVDEVNHHVSEEEEGTHAGCNEEPAKSVVDFIIELTVSVDLEGIHKIVTP